MPRLPLVVAWASDTLHTPADGWGNQAVTYVVLLVLILLTASLWEETAWAASCSVV